MALKQADRLESNNPKAYGIVRAIEVSGHRTVSSLENLYTIADCILSDSKKNINNDALGQSWYVISEGINYQLVDWDNRSSATGWKKLETDLSSYVTTDQLKTETDKKQDKLVQGRGIIIDEETNTISCELDVDLFKIVDELPAASEETTNKIYLKLAVSSGSDDKYVEYITTVTGEVGNEVYAWEKLGEYSASIDLTDYLKSSDAESIYLKLVDAESLYATKDEISDMETQTHAASTYQTITQAETDHKAITDRIDGIVSDQGANSTLDGYVASEETGDSLKVVESDTIKEGIAKLEKSISDNKTSASEEVSTLGLKVTSNETAITNLQNADERFETRVSAAETTISDNTTAISDLTAEVDTKASKDTVTTSTDGLMSAADKVKFDGIFAGNLALPTPSLSGFWSYFDNAGEAVSITPESGNRIEKGYQAQWIGTYSWNHDDAKKDPTQVQSGSNWTDLPTTGVASSSYDSGLVSTNTTIKVGIQAAKTGLMVSGSDVKPASGFDTTTASTSVTFLDRLYYGVSTVAAGNFTEENIKALLGTALVTSKSKTITEISCESDQYYVYAYPSSLGELSTIIQDGATPVLGAFTLVNTITITNASGKSGIVMNVYVSNNPGAFTNAKLAFS